MPIYEYKCNSCDNMFEVLTTSISSVETISCDKCKSIDVTKVLSAGSFKLSTNSTAIPCSQAPGCGKGSRFS